MPLYENHIRVRIVGDTSHPDAPEARITTFEIYDPRFLLAEWNTHGLLAKSAQSSRAIPVKTKIRQVTEEPWIPMAFGRNRPGMQATENLSDDESLKAVKIWRKYIGYCTEVATELAELEVHKQYANRVLEPVSHVYHIVTATEWQNFFDLRDSDKAQPEFQYVAQQMQKLLWDNLPIIRRQHLPYITPSEYTMLDSDMRLHSPDTDEMILVENVSAARCARISYAKFDGVGQYTAAEDAMLAQNLRADGHMSPFDHVAVADTLHASAAGVHHMWDNPGHHGRYWGWVPYRSHVQPKAPRRNSFAAFKV